MASALKNLPFVRAGTIMVMTQAFRRKAFQPNVIRNYASGSAGGKGGGSRFGLWAALAAAGGAGGGYYIWSMQSSDGGSKGVRKQEDYQKVYDAIAKILEDNPQYDDGSYGPVLLRLAWHASGTYDKTTKDGGSGSGSMRFEPECKHGANAGLHVAREKLEKIKTQFPWISYGDLWTLGGVVAVQEMGGPAIVWRPGRVDGTAQNCPPDGRLPDGGNPTPQHPRDVFYRMGFNDQEIVALVGAHGVGRCHTDRSGFDGPWTFSPTTFSNAYYSELLNRKWVEKKMEWTEAIRGQRNGKSHDAAG